MRSIVILVLGLAIGAIAAVSALNALRQRDAYPRGLMNVMQYHYATLRSDVRGQRCSDSARHLAMLKTLTGDIDGAIFPDSSPEPPFLEYETRLTQALDQSSAAAPTCATLAPTLEKITAACDACHHQYR